MTKKPSEMDQLRAELLADPRVTIGSSVMADMEAYMAAQKRPAPFDYHNCWRCRSGQLACVEGDARRCSFLHARDD